MWRTGSDTYNPDNSLLQLVFSSVAFWIRRVLSPFPAAVTFASLQKQGACGTLATYSFFRRFFLYRHLLSKSVDPAMVHDVKDKHGPAAAHLCSIKTSVGGQDVHTPLNFGYVAG
jgi:hypothetical protein